MIDSRERKAATLAQDARTAVAACDESYAAILRLASRAVEAAQASGRRDRSADDLCQSFNRSLACIVEARQALAAALGQLGADEKRDATAMQGEAALILR